MLLMDMKISSTSLELANIWANIDHIYILPGLIITLIGILVFSSHSILGIMRMRKKKAFIRGIVMEVGGEESYAICNAKYKEKLVQVPWEGATTVAALFEQACNKYYENRFVGVRKVVDKKVMEADDGSGRLYEKLHLGEYEWESYGRVYDRASNFGSGLFMFGHNVDARLAIFSETRPQWFIALQGCFRQNITVVTVYASLGEEALIHSLNETHVSTLICESKQLGKIAAIKSKLKTLENVIYFAEDGESCIFESMDALKVASFEDVEKLGQNNPLPPRLPLKDDIAVIMYTSGSTGLPKGVMMTHGSIIANVSAVIKVLPSIGIKDVYIAYLPLAHIMELEAEIIMLASGAAIGYGSTLTLADTSSKILKGTKGDASALHPTLMAAVPAILDRIRDGVLLKVEEKGGLIKKLFKVGYKRRLAAIEGSWLGAWGLEKILWDVIVFRRIRTILGGHIRLMLSGAAPLSRDSQRFLNICIGAPVGQAYGLTETCAGATFSEWDDTSVGRVGAPLPCCYVKLVSWEEGGYLISDKPLPRGEIVVGGLNVTNGYFNNHDTTKQVYKGPHYIRNGTGWFYTGDIGQFHPDGCLEIIDRKKDIVKLQHGEYISLGKVEASLILSNYIESIMVYGDPFHDYIVALIVPSNSALQKWAQLTGVQYQSFPELCDKVEAINEIQASIIKVAKGARLNKFEIPRKIKLLPESWTPESGLVTASLKLKRELIKLKFEDELKYMYA